MKELNLKNGASLKGVHIIMISMAKVMTKIASTFGVQLVITSGTDSLNLHGGGDRTKTLHDDGLALDIRTKNFLNINDLEKFLAIARILYPEFDFVLEKTHIHAEYDIKCNTVF